MQDIFDSKISYNAKQSQELFLLRSPESNSCGDHIIRKKKDKKFSEKLARKRGACVKRLLCLVVLF